MSIYEYSIVRSNSLFGFCSGRSVEQLQQELSDLKATAQELEAVRNIRSLPMMLAQY